jgi:hypothetical protein
MVSSSAYPTIADRECVEGCQEKGQKTRRERNIPCTKGEIDQKERQGIGVR